MYFKDINYLSIFECLFIECFSKYSGGSLEIRNSSDASINNCSFLHSYGDDFGGAVSLYYSNNLTLTCSSFFNCSSPSFYTFFRTDSGYGGGIEAEHNNKTYICNCSFTSCFATLQGIILIIFNIYL
jgi:hypothetical protein